MADYYTVQGGDSYEKIARMLYGNERMFGELMRANGGNPLTPGMTLYLPPKVDNPFVSNEQATGQGMATSDQYAAWYNGNPKTNQGTRMPWSAEQASTNQQAAYNLSQGNFGSLNDALTGTNPLTAAGRGNPKGMIQTPLGWTMPTPEIRTDRRDKGIRLPAPGSTSKKNQYPYIPPVPTPNLYTRNGKFTGNPSVYNPNQPDERQQAIAEARLGRLSALTSQLGDIVTHVGPQGIQLNNPNASVPGLDLTAGGTPAPGSFMDVWNRGNAGTPGQVNIPTGSSIAASAIPEKTVGKTSGGVKNDTQDILTLTEAYGKKNVDQLRLDANGQIAGFNTGTTTVQDPNTGATTETVNPLSPQMFTLLTRTLGAGDTKNGISPYITQGKGIDRNLALAKQLTDMGWVKDYRTGWWYYKPELAAANGGAGATTPSNWWGGYYGLGGSGGGGDGGGGGGGGGGTSNVSLDQLAAGNMNFRVATG